MVCKTQKSVLLAFLFIVGVAFISWSCKESLPVYVNPQHVIKIEISKIEQLNDHIAPPNRPLLHVIVQGENIYDEVFWDSVNIKGTIRVWWKRKPVRYQTLFITEKNLSDRSLIQNKKMMLLPGQRFTFDAYWNMRSYDGVWLVNEMDFTFLNKRRCGPNLVCGSPEDFVAEVSVSIYDRLGYLIAPVKEFVYYPRMCVNIGWPPCP